MPKPKVSIITACLNAEEKLEKTIQSVLSQDFKNLEHIIIDGLSGDGTVDIIHRYNKYIAYWVSEKDKGIADAFNKGFLASSGDWVVFLNAGDAYYDSNSLAKLMHYEADYDVVYGGFKCYRKSNNHPIYYKAQEVNSDIYWLKEAIPHQSCITRRAIFEKVGLFDTDFKCSMDYEHFLRAYKQGFRFKAIDEVITEVCGSGKTATHWKGTLQEFLLSQKKHGILPGLRVFYYWERFFRTYMYHKLGYF
jgi:glycosyltransferase involved in cell wall biosynthesis